MMVGGAGENVAFGLKHTIGFRKKFALLEQTMCLICSQLLM